MSKPWEKVSGCSVGVLVNGRVYTLEFAGSQERGRADYAFVGHTLDGGYRCLESIPSDRVFRRLAKKILDCDYKNDVAAAQRSPPEICFCFSIASGTTQESRAAFLAAVVASGLR